jgi:Prefoldin subunit
LQKVSKLEISLTPVPLSCSWHHSEICSESLYVLTFFKQLVQEIESQAIQSQQQISVVRSQIAGKQREIRMLELTSKEVSELPSGTNIYEGVGKM